MQIQRYIRLLDLPLICLTVLCAVGLLTSCASTEQMRTASSSGFLNNYEQLKPGKNDQALLIYRAPDLGHKKYTEVIIDPITVYPAEKSKLLKLPQDQIQILIDYFDAAVREKVGEILTITDTPSAETMRLRIALTEAGASRPLRDVTSTIMPYGIAINLLKKTVTGTHSAVGRAQAEIEVLDSISGRRLGAAVDARSGGKSPQGIFDQWNDVKKVFDFWSDRIRDRIIEARQGSK